MTETTTASSSSSSPPATSSAADIPTVRLAGKDWPVPLMGVKQLRIAAPAIMELLPTFTRMAEANATASTDPLWFTKTKITTAEFDLLCDAIYVGVVKGTPGLARTEFDNLVASFTEILEAFPVIARQTGIFKVGPADTTLGEAEAAMSRS